MVTILAAIAGLEAIVIAFLFYCFNRIFKAARDDVPVEPIRWEDWK